jgi:hypothetical protein
VFRRTAPSTKGRSFLHVIKLVSPFVTVVLLQAAIAGFSLEVMSSVRAYVAGEALWSRSQKNAVYFLNLYLHSGDASQFAQYQASLAVPIGDEFARWALERDPVDVEAARIGFLQGGNHPDDVPGLIWLFRYFKQVSFLKEAIREWAATDPRLLELSVFGEVIRSELKNGPVQDDTRLQLLSSRLSELNTQFTVHAKRFSTVLGEGSRAIKMILTGVHIVTAVMLILLLIWHTRRLVLQRQAFEDALYAEKERLAHQASHDWLTGLSNRRAFEARLQRELDNIATGSLGLILLDLDQFKSVNDSCGPPRGRSPALPDLASPATGAAAARPGGAARRRRIRANPSARHAVRRRRYRRTAAPVPRAIRLRLGRSLLCSDRQHRRCLRHRRQHHARGRDAACGCRLLSRQGERTQSCSGRQRDDGRHRRHLAATQVRQRIAALNTLSYWQNPEPCEMRIQKLFDLLAQHLRGHGHHALFEAEGDDPVHGGKQGA